MNSIGILGIESEKDLTKKEEVKAFKEAFHSFDWNNNGKISYSSLLYAMRRAGANPTGEQQFSLFFLL